MYAGMHPAPAFETVDLPLVSTAADESDLSPIVRRVPPAGGAPRRGRAAARDAGLPDLRGPRRAGDPRDRAGGRPAPARRRDRPRRRADAGRPRRGRAGGPGRAAAVPLARPWAPRERSRPAASSRRPPPSDSPAWRPAAGCRSPCSAPPAASGRRRSRRRSSAACETGYGLDPRSVAVRFDGDGPTLLAPVDLEGQVAALDLTYDPRSRRVAGPRQPGRAAGVAAGLRRGRRAARGGCARPAALDRGEPVKEGDVVMERRPRDAVAADAQASATAILGEVAQHALTAGTVLRVSDTAPPELVARGENVTIVYETPSISLSMRGLANEARPAGRRRQRRQRRLQEGPAGHRGRPRPCLGRPRPRGPAGRRHGAGPGDRLPALSARSVRVEEYPARWPAAPS